MNERAKHHGNSLKSKKKQHLYLLYDQEDRTIHKFGISGNTLDDQDKCSRIKTYLRILNEGAGIYGTPAGF